MTVSNAMMQIFPTFWATSCIYVTFNTCSKFTLKDCTEGSGYVNFCMQQPHVRILLLLDSSKYAEHQHFLGSSVNDPELWHCRCQERGRWQETGYPALQDTEKGSIEAND